MSTAEQSSNSTPVATDLIDQELLKKNYTQGKRVSGRDWKDSKTAFRVKSFCVKKSSWDKKNEVRIREKALREKLNELKQEKEDERKQRIDTIKQRRADKEEKERYERLSAKMTAKKIERLKRREKRNKLLKER
ncbi:unnamed protein product [[Candida] boidinii]|uniref:rRNA-processing protein n=1 Tax=Candida boidinii TaxID=5477 RepID=A0A9W6WKU3_CANBO|nr:hypothetical protein B5S30_g4969 [[Candida] boidinii]OWB86939.1 hypothetical protein B5S33_g5666 [[Candida] boidinii]GME77266.1 unnamed protein product [[Candida] boidinii]GMG11102.1 unnamed protein product [[Candida] boidinii]GMG21675.1 unnamed protein product [[Candida] boidinii]